MPVLIGVVTHADYGDEDECENPLPRAALSPREIPDEVWTALAERGLSLAPETHTYLAVAGWSWTEINADGARVAGVAAEDDGFLRIDDRPAVMEGSATLTMRTSYC